MVRNYLSIAFAVFALISCSEKEDNGKEGGTKPDSGGNTTGYVREVEAAPEGYEYPDLREASASEVLYTPSQAFRKYRPIDIQYYGGSAPQGTPAGSWNPSWTTGKARIVHYMVGYEPAFKTYEKYTKWTNKWGSTKTKEHVNATGRFRVEKINGRWWIIDPMGYFHYERSVTSFRYGSSARNSAAWNAKYGTDEKWILDTQQELARNGFHGTGAFCTNTYSKIISHNLKYPLAPLTLAPSFGFLSQFKSASKHTSASITEAPIALVLEADWPQFCIDYMKGSAFEPYRNNQHVLGFFSDNEINFSANAASGKLLKIFLNISDVTDKGRMAAEEFLRSKGATAYSDELNDEFCGMLAEKYYSAVKAARDAVDPGLMYLGSRLHGTPKYMEHVVRACGKYCDIVSINYYSRWSPELDTRVKDWATWADRPFLVTEFYVKGVYDSDLNNASGAGWAVPRQEDRAYWYQHFTLGLLEAKNCVGWHWFKYQDDDGSDNSNCPANKGMYDNSYNIYPILSRFAREVNYNVYDIIDYFDNNSR